ncbi:hypothetical protein HPP92_024957 [Vanilla planifolia]|uniref:60S ribosomal protein L32 n=1 Tax=Vanilla planifolia TaxID=51239 RepID=A0A835U9Y5_VANPL|nr:hypothetical protein HPP92_024957 [Vanilla planifolia]
MPYPPLEMTRDAWTVGLVTFFFIAARVLIKSRQHIGRVFSTSKRRKRSRFELIVLLHLFLCVEMAVPLLGKKIVKKRVKKFKRPQSDRKICVKVHEIRVELDVQRLAYLISKLEEAKGYRFSSEAKIQRCTLMPNIGYGSDKKTRHYLPNKFRKFLVHNVSDLELLMMHNRTYCARLPTAFRTRKRREIVERAAQLDIVVTNKLARLRSQEDE